MKMSSVAAARGRPGNDGLAARQPDVAAPIVTPFASTQRAAATDETRPWAADWHRKRCCWQHASARFALAWRLRRFRLSQSSVRLHAGFPALRFRSSVTVSPCSVSAIRTNYVYSRKNCVACVKITFSVSISLPFPLIRSSRIEFYFSVSVRYTTRKRRRRRRYGTAVRTRLRKRLRKRIRMNGYAVLETRHWIWSRWFFVRRRLLLRRLVYTSSLSAVCRLCRLLVKLTSCS